MRISNSNSHITLGGVESCGHSQKGLAKISNAGDINDLINNVVSVFENVATTLFRKNGLFKRIIPHYRIIDMRRIKTCF